MLQPPSAVLGYIVRPHPSRGEGRTQGMVTCPEDKLTLLPTDSVLLKNKQSAWTELCNVAGNCIPIRTVTTPE